MKKRLKTQTRGIPAVIITCEHGGNRVPTRYRKLFAEAAEILNSHRAWDPGALTLARQFARILNAPLHCSSVTRLLVELNRSLHHPRLFSEFTASLSANEKQTLLKEHWYPYRCEVEDAISTLIQDNGRVVHLSVHSFTPVWNGETRRTDVGLLYDPRRVSELAFCRSWARNLSADVSGLTVHRNAPYRGTSDGFVTALRQQFAEDAYTGIELEVNQKYFASSGAKQRAIFDSIITSFQQTLTRIEVQCPGST